MEEMIAGGIILALAKLTLAAIALRLVVGVIDYFFDHAWIRWTLGVLVCGVAYVSYENLWAYIWDHAPTWLGVALVLPLPIGVLLLVREGLQNAHAFLKGVRTKNTSAKSAAAPSAVRHLQMKLLSNVYAFARNRLGRLSHEHQFARTRVFHQKFGCGVVLFAEGNKLLVCFDHVPDLKRVIDSFVEPVFDAYDPVRPKAIGQTRSEI